MFFLSHFWQILKQSYLKPCKLAVEIFPVFIYVTNAYWVMVHSLLGTCTVDSSPFLQLCPGGGKQSLSQGLWFSWGAAELWNSLKQHKESKLNGKGPFSTLLSVFTHGMSGAVCYHLNGIGTSTSVRGEWAQPPVKPKEICVFICSLLFFFKWGNGKNLSNLCFQWLY